MRQLPHCPRRAPTMQRLRKVSLESLLAHVLA